MFILDMVVIGEGLTDVASGNEFDGEEVNN